MNKKILLTIVVSFIMTLAVPAFATVFRTSDLTGNWYVYTMEVNPSMPAVYWIWGNVDMDESGNLTGTYYTPDGSSVILSSAQLSLDHKGIISGFFTAGGGYCNSCSWENGSEQDVRGFRISWYRRYHGSRILTQGWRHFHSQRS